MQSSRAGATNKNAMAKRGALEAPAPQTIPSFTLGGGNKYPF